MPLRAGWRKASLLALVERAMGKATGEALPVADDDDDDDDDSDAAA